jgi:hypothetical protein
MLNDSSADLYDAIAECYADPLKFVLLVYPWGVPGTILAKQSGPDDWQKWVLEQLRTGSLTLGQAVQIAVASGHGIGKTALVAWIVHWFISTRPNPQIVVTANTQNQLDNKTWRELARWWKISIHAHWFEWTATKFYLKASPETWFAAAIPWSEKNSEAFAGTHEEHVLLIFDEASGIADIIWEVAEGAMTTPGAMWIAFGNPTKNTGRFRQCFGKLKHRWTHKQVDSRTAKMAEKKKLQEWVDDYGEDSDFVRVRVRGVFPRAGSNQFISSEDVEICRHYVATGYECQPMLLGVDVARFGDDKTIIRPRQGRKVFPAEKYRGLDTMEVADRVIEAMTKYKPQVTFVDGGGLGAGVVDRLKQLGYGRQVVDVNAGSKALDDVSYFNLRAEMWGRMRDAIKAGVDLPADDIELADDLTGIEYGYTPKQQVQLEKKADMKKRGLASPDDGDGLALTYAKKVLLKPKNTARAAPMSIA